MLDWLLFIMWEGLGKGGCWRINDFIFLLVVIEGVGFVLFENFWLGDK